MTAGERVPTTAPIEPPLLSAEDARWGVVIGWASRPEPLVQVDADAELRVASVAKLLLLAACASAIESGELDPRQQLDRRTVPPVADSGIWQHLEQQTLSVHDVATLIGIASDNLATNVLLETLRL
ncbi:MAG: serine hydrolase, partial [Agrococcus sp.]